MNTHPLCADNSAHTKYKIYEGRNWRLQIHRDQRYLGRSVVWLTSRHVSNMPLESLSTGELQELFGIMRKFRVALNRLWKPELINACWLGNNVHEHDGHGHMHLIPRYRTPPQYMGGIFRDERWGRNYAPYEPFRLRDADLFAIRDVIASKHPRFKR